MFRDRIPTVAEYLAVKGQHYFAAFFIYMGLIILLLALGCPIDNNLMTWVMWYPIVCVFFMVKEQMTIAAGLNAAGYSYLGSFVELNPAENRPTRTENTHSGVSFTATGNYTPPPGGIPHHSRNYHPKRRPRSDR